MIEVLYRIYEVADKPISEEQQSFGFYNSLSKDNSYEIAMDCMICENRQAFKNMIQELYGNEIKFAYSRKYPVGTVYCIIIGEHCYEKEKYFNRIEYDCSCCGVKIISHIKGGERLKGYEIKNELCNQIDRYSGLRFCSYKCKEHFIERERRKCLDDGLVDESFITKDSFDNTAIAGYIYKITKKSSGEFYVGQTIYAPVFRWGQHLKTTRFDISRILDYQFEVIEIVNKNDNILDREKFWIQKLYKQNPKKSLNIACVANLNPAQIGLDELPLDDIKKRTQSPS